MFEVKVKTKLGMYIMYSGNDKSKARNVFEFWNKNGVFRNEKILDVIWCEIGE